MKSAMLFSKKCGTCGGPGEKKLMNCRKCRKWHQEFDAERLEMSEKHYVVMQEWMALNRGSD